MLKLMIKRRNYLQFNEYMQLEFLKFVTDFGFYCAPLDGDDDDGEDKPFTKLIHDLEELEDIYDALQEQSWYCHSDITVLIGKKTFRIVFDKEGIPSSNITPQFFVSWENVNGEPKRITFEDIKRQLLRASRMDEYKAFSDAENLPFIFVSNSAIEDVEVLINNVELV